jgi:hypothetical protein
MAAEVKSFRCPNCSGELVVRAPEKSEVVGCQHCGALLDVTHPDAALIQLYEKKVRIRPLIPLGRRGQLAGQPLETLGMLRRQVVVEGTPYSWDEYLLWNPYVGYRWLTEYAGHWTFVKPCTGTPRELPGAKFEYEERIFRLFQTAQATTTYVLGEFYWQVKRGDKAMCADHVCPPYILSREKSPEEVAWSIGEYMTGGQVWEAFKLEGTPPPAIGVGACQPNPLAPKLGAMTGMFLAFAAAALVVQMAAVSLSRKELVLEQNYVHQAADAEKSRVSPYFDLKGRTSNVRVDLTTDLNNQWAYFHCALIKEDTEEAINFGREVEYYHGVDSDGSWTEGSRRDSGFVPRVPSGRYYLRIEPETPASQMNYTVRITRDVPRWLTFWCVLSAIVLPYVIFFFRKRSFEARRWMESDFPSER